MGAEHNIQIIYVTWGYTSGHLWSGSMERMFIRNWNTVLLQHIFQFTFTYPKYSLYVLWLKTKSFKGTQFYLQTSILIFQSKTQPHPLRNASQFICCKLSWCYRLPSVPVLSPRFFLLDWRMLVYLLISKHIFHTCSSLLPLPETPQLYYLQEKKQQITFKM